MAMSEAEKAGAVGAKGRGGGATSHQIRLDLAVQLAASKRSGYERRERGEALRAGLRKREDLLPEIAQAQDQLREKQAQLPNRNGQAGDPIAVRQPAEAGRKLIDVCSPSPELRQDLPE